MLRVRPHSRVLHDRFSTQPEIVSRHNPGGSSPVKYGSYPLKRRHSKHSGRRSSPLRNHRTCCRSGQPPAASPITQMKQPHQIINHNRGTHRDSSAAGPSRPCQQMATVQTAPRCGAPTTTSFAVRIAIPVFCRSPLYLQMRSCLEYVRDFRVPGCR